MVAVLAAVFPTLHGCTRAPVAGGAAAVATPVPVAAVARAAAVPAAARAVAVPATAVRAVATPVCAGSYTRNGRGK